MGFEYDKVEYQWDNGNGGGILYDPEDRAVPESDTDGDGETHEYKLYVSIGDNFLLIDSDEDLLWVSVEDMEGELDRALPNLFEK